MKIQIERASAQVKEEIGFELDTDILFEIQGELKTEAYQHGQGLDLFDIEDVLLAATAVAKRKGEK